MIPRSHGFRLCVLALALLPACAGPEERPAGVLSSEQSRDIEACFQEADQALRGGDLDRAEAALTRALGVHPDLAEAYFERGKIHLRRLKLDGELKEGETAIRDFSEAIRIVPSSKALYDRAVAYYQLGERWPDFYRRAAQDLKRLLMEVNPRDADAHYFLARICDEKLDGLEAEAIQHYQKHIEHGGRRPDAAPRMIALAARMPAPAETPAGARKN